LSEGVCYFSPPADDASRQASDKATPETAEPRTLVIFLHPLVGDGSSWQWEQQRMLARAGTKLGFSVLMPRGRRGIGPGRDPNTLAWPTSAKMQEEHETAIIAEWMAAKNTVEQRDGKFERVFVFGFSNGAYYGTSLALRGHLPVDGYGIFAGGSGSKYLQLSAQKAEHRAPIFVGYGTKDPAHRGQQELIKLLRKLGWKHRSRSARVGHTVTYDQLHDAVRFLRSPG
jgi:predicted esterase